MEKLLLILALISLPELVHAQRFREWLRQKKTQKEYLIEQIAQLKLYLELTEKGYKIAKEGLTAIADFKEGEFKLHKNRFDTLRIVNSKIASSAKVKEIKRFYSQIQSIKGGTLPRLYNNDFFIDQELTYLRAVFDRLHTDADQTMDALEIVLEDGNLAMTDDERIKRIEDLYERMLFNWKFSKAFSNEAAALAAAREKEAEDVRSGLLLHGIN
jgi:hypothetical protein